MLKQRLITAAILIPLVVWALLDLQSGVVMLLFTAVSLLAAWEWLSLTDIKNNTIKASLLSLLFLLGGLAMLSLHSLDEFVCLAQCNLAGDFLCQQTA